MPGGGYHPPLFFAAVLGAALLTVVAPAGAQPTWPDGSLLPEDHDWVRLPSDEWLKGDVKAMYDDELGIVMLDWEDIKELRSSEILQVRATGGRIAVGRVVLENGELNIWLVRAWLVSTEAQESLKIAYVRGLQNSRQPFTCSLFAITRPPPANGMRFDPRERSRSRVHRPP